MVSSEQINTIWVFDFEAKKERNGLNWVVSSIDEVSDHDKLAVGDSSTFFEHLLNIVELSMNITCDFDWAIHWYDVWLLSEDASDHVAKLPDSWLCDGFAGPCLFEPMIDAHLGVFSNKY